MAEPVGSEIRSGRRETQCLRAGENPCCRAYLQSERWAAACSKLLRMAACLVGDLMTLENNWHRGSWNLQPFQRKLQMIFPASGKFTFPVFGQLSVRGLLLSFLLHSI